MSTLRRHKMKKRLSMALKSADIAWKANLNAWRQIDNQGNWDKGARSLVEVLENLETMDKRLLGIINETNQIIKNTQQFLP